MSRFDVSFDCKIAECTSLDRDGALLSRLFPSISSRGDRSLPARVVLLKFTNIECRGLKVRTGRPEVPSRDSPGASCSRETRVKKHYNEKLSSLQLFSFTSLPRVRLVD